MNDETEEWASIVPAEVDGDTAYAGGEILRRGRLLEFWEGHPIYEWHTVPICRCDTCR